MAKKSNIEKSIDKQKKAHPVAFLLVVIFLVVGAVAGYFTVRYLTRDDRFELIGEQTITLNVGETYIDEGAVAISFGRDVSDKIVTETDVDSMVAGRYYIKYTIDDIRYSGVVKYRYIVYLEETSSQNDEVVSEQVLPMQVGVEFQYNLSKSSQDIEIPNVQENILRGGELVNG